MILVAVLVGMLLLLLVWSRVPLDPVVRTLLAAVLLLALAVWVARAGPNAWRVCETRAVYNLPRPG